jgi:hypothetical protein
MRITVAVASLFILVLSSHVAGQGKLLLAPDQVKSHFKSITATDNDYVFVHGRWKRTAGNTTLNKPPRINTVAVTCDKKIMTCKEIIAMLVTPQEEFMFEEPQLYVEETIYRVIDWANDTIRATYGAPVADFELRISVRDKMAERHWRETKAYGRDTSDAKNFENWILE